MTAAIEVWNGLNGPIVTLVLFAASLLWTFGARPIYRIRRRPR